MTDNSSAGVTTNTPGGGKAIKREKTIGQYVWEKQSEGVREIYKLIQTSFSIKNQLQNGKTS